MCARVAREKQYSAAIAVNEGLVLVNVTLAKISVEYGPDNVMYT